MAGPVTRRKYSLSTFMMLIVFVAVLPVIIFAGTIINDLVQSKREANTHLIERSAEDLVVALDQEIGSTIRTLQALAETNSLKDGDLKAFHEVAERVLKSQPSWGNILVHDSNANWLMSARVPNGTPLTRSPEPESLLQVVRSGGSVVGKIIKLPPGHNIAGEYGFAIRVPVKNESGKVVYVLSAIMSTDPLQQLLGRTGAAPGEWVRGLVDSQGTMAARSRDPEKYVGQANQATLERMRSYTDGRVQETTTFEGRHVYSAFRRAPRSGWYAGVAVPSEVLEAQVVQTQTAILGVALAILAISALLTIYFSSWIRKAIRSATESAAQLARGHAPDVWPTRISEIAELRESLMTASELLRSRDRAKSDFLANMSHELRTPLGLVLGMTDLLSRDLVSPEDRERSWEIVKRNGEQLLRLIDDILDISKVDADRLVIELVDFSLRDLISSVVEDFTPRTREKGVELKFIVEEGAPTVVNSDPVRVRQIIFNLVGNAVKFTHEGSIIIKLSPADGSFARLTVTDTGIGLNETQQKVLFTDFTQGDSSHSRRYGGTGLGLSLSRKLARLLQGDVRLLESHPGRGSMFEATFKLAPLQGGAAERGYELREHVAQIPQGTNILLAEDSTDNVALIKNYLKNSGVNVMVAENGRAAFDLALRNPFDVILMDIQMPEMDGYEATRLIRGAGVETPIIALTAHALDEHKERALKTGFSDYLTKPIKRQSLIQAIEKSVSP